MSELQALIFDVDGTLADTERDGHRVAFNRAFADAGLDWDWDVDLYGKLLTVTGGKERIKYYLAEFRKQPDLLDDEAIASLHAAKTAHFTRMLADGDLPPRPGVRRLLDEARAVGLRLAIATTTTPANVEALLAHSFAPDAASWFEVIAAGDVVPAKKPAPDIYLLALRELGLSAEDCVALEDSDNGLRASLGAGLRTVISVNDYTREQNFRGAELVVDQLGELNSPCRVLSGGVAESGMVDVQLLRALVGQLRPAGHAN